MMEAASISETLVNFYWTTQHNNPENSHLHTRHCENLKSHNKLDRSKIFLLQATCSWTRTSHQKGDTMQRTTAVPFPLGAENFFFTTTFRWLCSPATRGSLPGVKAVRLTTPLHHIISLPNCSFLQLKTLSHKKTQTSAYI
jgi:hypothetical protein